MEIIIDGLILLIVILIWAGATRAGLSNWFKWKRRRFDSWRGS